MPQDLRVLKALILGILLLASFSSGIGFGWFKRRFNPRGSHQRNASNDSQLISTTRIPLGLVNLGATCNIKHKMIFIVFRLGNTCYLNSVLQGLFHTKEFRDELLRLTFTEGSPGYWLQDIFR